MLPSNFLLYSRLTLVCNTSMSGYILNTGSLLLWKHSLTSPSAGGSIWSLLLLPAALSSVGSYWLSGTLQCSCSTTAWFQSHQACSGFPDMQLCAKQDLSLSSLGLGCVVNRKYLYLGLPIQQFGSTLWYFSIHFFAVCWRLYYIFCY